MVSTKSTFTQHYQLPNLRDDIRTHFKVCKTFHKNWKQNLKYGKLTTKKAESISWDRLLVNLIGPYKIIRKGNDEPLMIEELTMVDPAIGWFKII